MKTRTPVRMTIRITATQDAVLQKKSDEYNVSKVEVIRQAIDLLDKTYDNTEKDLD